MSTKLATKLTTTTTVTDTPDTVAKKPLRGFTDAVVIYFDTEKTPNKTEIKFRATDGIVRTAVANPAIRWKDKLGKPMLLKIDDTCKPWKLALKPTEEELNAYETAQVPAYEEVERTTEDDEALDF